MSLCLAGVSCRLCLSFYGHLHIGLPANLHVVDFSAAEALERKTVFIADSHSSDGRPLCDDHLRCSCKLRAPLSPTLLRHALLNSIHASTLPFTAAVELGAGQRSLRSRVNLAQTPPFPNYRFNTSENFQSSKSPDFTRWRQEDLLRKLQLLSSLQLQSFGKFNNLTCLKFTFIWKHSYNFHHHRELTCPRMTDIVTHHPDKA